MCELSCTFNDTVSIPMRSIDVWLAFIESLVDKLINESIKKLLNIVSKKRTIKLLSS